MPKLDGKRETVKLMDFLTGSGSYPIQVKKITRKGSQRRAILMTNVVLSGFSTPEQKAEALKEIKHTIIKQTGRVVSRKVKEAFDL